MGTNSETYLLAVRTDFRHCSDSARLVRTRPLQISEKSLCCFVIRAESSMLTLVAIKQVKLAMLGSAAIGHSSVEVKRHSSAR